MAQDRSTVEVLSKVPDKPLSDGGLALSRPIASAVIAPFIVLCLLVLPQRPGRHPGAYGAALSD